jgi:hypothetical protein
MARLQYLSFLSLSLSSLCLAGEALSIIAFIWNDCKKWSFINIPA